MQLFAALTIEMKIAILSFPGVKSLDALQVVLRGSFLTSCSAITKRAVSLWNHECHNI